MYCKRNPRSYSRLHSQRDMESTEIDRVFQTLPFSQERDLFDKTTNAKTPLPTQEKDTDRP